MSDINKTKNELDSLSESERLESRRLNEKQWKLQQTKVNLKINRFVRRLKVIGINVDLGSNYPWVYLISVNGTFVNEKYAGNHGFTILFQTDPEAKFTDRRKVFAKVREVLNGDEVKPVYKDDLLDIVSGVIDSIDELKSYAWSEQKESDVVFEDIFAILEKEFNYPKLEDY